MSVQRVLAALKALLEPEAVTELRILSAPGLGTVSGYFDAEHRKELAAAAATWSGKAAVYLTPNPVNPALLARAENRVKPHAKTTTADRDVSGVARLLIDFDPVRPSGISATDAEHAAALARMEEAAAWLGAQGWPEPLKADSGNGGHLVYALALSNSQAKVNLLKRVLEALAFRFDDGSVVVDTTTHNPARIWRVYGTLNLKGDSTQERPHRLAQVLSVPKPWGVVPLESLEPLAASLPPQQRQDPNPRRNSSPMDVDGFLAQHGLEVARSGPWQDGKRWVLRTCPWNSDHQDRSAYVLQFASGAVAAGCQHNGCSGKAWADLRALFDPFGYERSPWPEPPGVPANDGQAAPFKVRRMADVAPESVSWLWYPYIPKGKLTLLEGDPGVGKSWVALAIAAAVSLGRGLPGMEVGEPANVLLASAEDGLGDTIRPHLDAMGADARRIHAIDGPLTLDDTGFLSLESAIVAVRPALLVLDPLVAYLGGGLDIHRANEVRHVMARLARLAETHGLAELSVRHLTKGGALKPIYRGLGSIDFTAACRSVLLAGYAADSPQARGLVHIKSNLAPIGPPIGYELRDGHFYWTGESLLTAADILAADDGAGASKLEAAIAFLQDVLADGPVPAVRVLNDSRGAGLAERTVNRAKAKLHVVTHRQGSTGKRGGGGFMWHLPGDLHCQDCHIEDYDNVNHPKAKNKARASDPGNLNGVEV